tara:strand:+ start:3402 stop:4172 length:771 start_codon:yes stop_codon:yes gene_type:complete
VSDLPSIEELRHITQPPSVINRPNGEHWMGRLYFRKISPYFTREALRIGLSANQVTYMMIFFGLLGAWSFAFDGLLALLGFLGIQIYLLLDCVDGEVARFKKTEGARGVYLDRWGHYVVEGSIIIAFSLRASESSINGYLVLGLLGSILALLSKIETDLVDSARYQAGFGVMPEKAIKMKSEPLAYGRKIIRYLPFHRVLHAAEASIAGSVAIIIQAITGNSIFSEIFTVWLFSTAAIVAPLHLVSILNSSRLISE